VLTFKDAQYSQGKCDGDYEQSDPTGGIHGAPPF